MENQNTSLHTAGEQASAVEQIIRVDNLIITVIALSEITVSDSESFSLPHNHNAFELRLVQNGIAVIHAGDACYTVRHGDLFIVPPLTYHFFVPVEGEHLYYRSIRFNIKPDESKESIRSYDNIMKYISRPVLLRERDTWPAILLERIEKEFREGKPGHMNRIAALSTSLILTVMQFLFPDANLRWNDECTAYNMQRETVIEQFYAYHFAEDISIDGLAQELHLSPRQVNRILFDLYGCSFIRKLLEVRLENVKVTLLHSDKSISDIAASCGFRTIPYFYTAFRRYCGCTPSQYIEKYPRSL